jgi:hypothetical protein
MASAASDDQEIIVHPKGHGMEYTIAVRSDILPAAQVEPSAIPQS